MIILDPLLWLFLSILYPKMLESCLQIRVLLFLRRPIVYLHPKHKIIIQNILRVIPNNRWKQFVINLLDDVRIGCDEQFSDLFVC